MKNTLLIDGIIQALVITLGFVWIFTDDVHPLAIYFVAGGIQVTSMLLHLPRFLEGKWVSLSRRRFYQFNLWVLLSGILCLLIAHLGADSPLILLVLLYLFAMLGVGIINTIWYFVITYSEYQYFKKEEEQRDLLDLGA